MSKAFEGIRVIDFTQVIAGPGATLQLALLGADVIKVENREGGDQLRQSAGTGRWRDLGLAPTFMSVNAAKRSVTLDLKHERAREIVERLVSEADVVVENFKGGTMDRLGFGYDFARRCNPSIIFCSISGFGQQGPKANRAAYDGAIQASTGLMSVTGTDETGPLRTGFYAVDMTTAQNAAFAVASALFRRERTGRGQFLDVAMNDSAIMMMNHVASQYLVGGRQPPRVGNDSATLQGTAGSWPTADGHLLMSVITDTQATRVCAALGHPEWADEPRYATATGRRDERDRIKAELGAIFVTETTATWLERLVPQGIPLSPINSLAEGLADEQLDHREVLMTLPPPQGTEDEIVLPGLGFLASEDSPGTDRPPPVAGQHTDEILAEIGYEPEEIAELRSQGAV